MTSKFIAIEGLDGAGKSTQIRLLIDHFESAGIKTKFVHFPRSGEGVFGQMIAQFLRGEFGDVKSVHPQLVALLFAQDRKDFAATIHQWMVDGYMVLVDRYVFSNIAFQCAKTQGESEKQTLREWILQFEFEYNKIPKPDLSVYLDVPFSFTHKSLNEKRDGDERDYLNGKDDIHEKDIDLQMAVKAEYEKLVSSEKEITPIVCYHSETAMKTVEEIHAEIVACIRIL